MKILTIAIPCYNSEAYMEKCIKSMLPAGEELEILIVDDGSTKDRTPQIADATRPAIRRSSGWYIRKTAVMVRQSMPDCATRQDAITRS